MQRALIYRLVAYQSCYLFNDNFSFSFSLSKKRARKLDFYSFDVPFIAGDVTRRRFKRSPIRDETDETGIVRIFQLDTHASFPDSVCRKWHSFERYRDSVRSGLLSTENATRRTGTRTRKIARSRRAPRSTVLPSAFCDDLKNSTRGPSVARSRGNVSMDSFICYRRTKRSKFLSSFFSFSFLFFLPLLFFFLRQTNSSNHLRFREGH